MCGESKRNDADFCIQSVLLPVIQLLPKPFGATCLARCSFTSASSRVNLGLWLWRMVLDVTAPCGLPQTILVWGLTSAEILAVALKPVVCSACALQVLRTMQLLQLSLCFIIKLAL